MLPRDDCSENSIAKVSSQSEHVGIRCKAHTHHIRAIDRNLNPLLDLVLGRGIDEFTRKPSADALVTIRIRDDVVDMLDQRQLRGMPTSTSEGATVAPRQAMPASRE